ncbi:MAG TPA: MBL fold metallo-hydrolase [Hyphomonadaceae bacterium]|nr:MBL fold metallo-hydrolase [Hyphomonadaceae bacterium]
MRLLALAIVAALANAPAFPQTPTTLASPAPASLVREGVTEKLTEHVWDIPDGSAPLVPNIGIVVGSKSVLVVDTGLGPRNGETVLKEVNKVALGKPIYIVATHFHPEHDLGAQAFPADAKMIRSKDQETDIKEFGLDLAKMFASRSALNADLLKDAQFRPAAVEFDKDYSLDLGGVKAKLIAIGPNHTRGDIAIFIEGDRVLFSGDVAMRGQPAFASPYSSISHWLASLDVLDALRPVHVVPSHGPRGDAQIIAGYRTYLTKIRNRAAELKKAGKTQDETVAAITDEMSGQYPDKGRLAGAIRNAWAEAK